MIPIKTKKQIKIMKEGGERLKRILLQLLAEVDEGIKTIELEELACKLIAKEQGEPSFKIVPGYHFATCVTLNDEVVHGIPGEKEIKSGDLVSLDLGFYSQGFHTDSASTIQVSEGKVGSEFLSAGRRALEKAIKQAKPGNYVGHISAAIEEEILKSHFYPVRQLAGHGIGSKLHEAPSVPCFLEGEIRKTPKLASGMVLAIEVIYTEEPTNLVIAPDGWTVKTKNGKMAGLFEKTVAVTEKGPLVLT